MMDYTKALLLVVAVFTLSACGGSHQSQSFENGKEGDNNENNAPETPIIKTFDDFKAEVAATLSSDAMLCGTVEINASELNINICIAEAFVNNQDFSTFYQLQGIDSSIAHAISRSQGIVYHWFYDSNPAGGIPAISSRIEGIICENPSLSGILDVHAKVFTCGDVFSLKTFDDFMGEVIAAFDSNAVYCGIVGINESELNANTCIAEAFVNSQDFSAFYQLQGIDSSVAHAMSRNHGVVYHWRYDSNIFGGPSSTGSSLIEGVVCENPALSGVLDVHDEVFNCDNNDWVFWW